jgi:hypothetical protein
VRLELVDAARDVVVGSLKFGVLDVEQEAADHAVARVAQLSGLGVAASRAQFRLRAEDCGRLAWAPRSPIYFDDLENASFRDKHGRVTR